MKYDIFISYRRNNGFFMAQVIRDRLEAIGVYPAPKTAAARDLKRTLAARRTAPPPLI